MSKICLPFNSYKQNISQLNAKYGKNMKNEQLRLALCFLSHLETFLLFQ